MNATTLLSLLQQAHRSRGDVFTYRKAGSVLWVNSVDGVDVSPLHFTQHAAIAAGRSIAMANRSEHTITDEQGRIREKNSYGGDPFPPRG